MVWRSGIFLMGCVWALTVAGARADDPPAGEPAGAEAAVRAAAASFADAFNRGDAQAVAALWTATGTLADDRGQLFKGRPAIAAEYTTVFKTYPGAKMEVAITSLEFPTPTLVVEDGVSRVSLPHARVPTASSYTAVHVLEDGKWLMVSVRERSIALSPVESHLQDLDWMVGNWVTTRDEVQLQATFSWIADKKFMQRHYTVRQQDAVVSSGVQVIGWNPQTGRIHSWSFDSSGGYGQGLWSVTSDGWSIESRGVLADGTLTTSRESLVRLPTKPDEFHWRSTQRMVGPKTLPDAEDVVMDRVVEK
ncbi:MAG: YybH family protein [Pirellulaceae bacterium]